MILSFKDVGNELAFYILNKQELIHITLATDIRTGISFDTFKEFFSTLKTLNIIKAVSKHEEDGFYTYVFYLNNDKNFFEIELYDKSVNANIMKQYPNDRKIMRFIEEIFDVVYDDDDIVF